MAAHTAASPALYWEEVAEEVAEEVEEVFFDIGRNYNKSGEF
jgi:hypothetical protein